MTNIHINEEGYVIIDGIEVAFTGSDDDCFWINPRNWLHVTRDMTLTEQGALFELIRTHVPGKTEVVS
jgi:hypothetical protein